MENDLKSVGHTKRFMMQLWRHPVWHVQSALMELNRVPLLKKLASNYPKEFLQ